MLATEQLDYMYMFLLYQLQKLERKSNSFVMAVTYNYFFFSVCKSNAEAVVPVKTYLSNIF